MSTEDHPQDVPDDDAELYGIEPAGEAAQLVNPHSSTRSVEQSAVPERPVEGSGIPGLSGGPFQFHTGSVAKAAVVEPPPTADTSHTSTGASEINQIGEDSSKADRKNDTKLGNVVASEGSADVAMVDSSEKTHDAATAGPASTIPSAGVDREFIEAAQANKNNDEAEWQYDTSDEETSSSESESSDSDDSDADGDYELLDPATAARMLMAEEGGEDDDGPASRNANKPTLKTKNEQEEVVVPRPDVTITEQMRLILLGTVDNLVENLALIKGSSSGEYQVLEPGSILCLEDRTVIGVVAETFGRVQQPLYSVAFTNEEEANSLGVRHGVSVYYVQEHSKFVFTQPLKGLKGTDASNIHDEEAGDDEAEFSDDEAESAHRRASKQRRNNKTGTRDSDAAPNAYHSANADRRIISYDDVDDTLEQHPTRGDRPPPQSHYSHGGFDRGRGRGGRGRGRGRGYRGRDDRGGGRGGDSYSDSAPPHGQPHTHQPYPTQPYAPAPVHGSYNNMQYQSTHSWPTPGQPPAYPSGPWPAPFAGQPGQVPLLIPPPPFPMQGQFNPNLWNQQGQYNQQAPQGQQMPQWPAQGQVSREQRAQPQAWPPQQTSSYSGPALPPDVQAILQHMETMRRANGGQQ